MLADLFKGLNSSLEDVLKNAEAGEGTIKDNMDDLCDILEDEILKSKSSEEEKKELLKRLRNFCNTETNIMLVGATGCGKSSTINALFAVGENSEEAAADDEDVDTEEKAPKKTYVEVAKVGSKVDPETKDIEKYRIGNLVLWDTPGLGDGTEIDEHHKEVIPELKDDTNRILITLNQADIAMKTGRHWDYEKNEPDETLVQFLEEKVQSIKTRIKEDSNLDIDPVYYCAGYEEEGGDVVRPYNLSKLLYYIMQSLPAQKRVAIMEGINTDSDNYEHNDDDEDYNEGIKDSFYDSFDYIGDGVDTGAEIGGTLLGIPGAIVGAFLGGFVGCVKCILDDIF